MWEGGVIILGKIDGLPIVQNATPKDGLPINDFINVLQYFEPLLPSPTHNNAPLLIFESASITDKYLFILVINVLI